MNKNFLQLLIALVAFFPLGALAQGGEEGGPLFDRGNSSGYGGGKVTLCFQDKTRTVNAKQAARLFARGATPGPCTPHGKLVITKTTTGGDGTFHFSSTNENVKDFDITTHNGTGKVTLSLAHGNYVITEEKDKNWNMTSNTCTVSVVSGATVSCAVVNAKVIRPGSISGTTYVDPSGNGKNFNKGIFNLLNRRGGITIYLDTNNNGVKNAGEPSRVSNFFGNYSFDNLPANMMYHVREVVPNGYTETYPSSKVYNEYLTSGEDVNGDDFANHLTPSRRDR